jgi:hypothetical protein
MVTIIQAKQRGNNERNQRWSRLERSDLFERYGALYTQGSLQPPALRAVGNT